MKIVVDMNRSPGRTDVLAAAGYCASHRSKVGTVDEQDRTIAEWPELDGRVVLTADLDFGRILGLGGRELPSVVQLRCDDTRHGIVGHSVVAIITAKSADLAAGAFVTFDGDRVRTRSLPL